MNRDEMEVENFVPERVSEKYVTFLVEYSKCHTCSKDMIIRNKNNVLPFPAWYKIDIDAQMKKGGFVAQSGKRIDENEDQYICVNCAKNIKTYFLCSLCEKRKSTDRIEEGIGAPSEYLCKDCYETVSAKVWNEKLDLLEEDHKYDGY